MDEIFEQIATGQMDPAIVTVAGILIFLGAMGKSGQFPLHVWLPDAMAGPTPVSALVHSATMVAAGVYLVARAYPLFAASPVTMAVIATIGTITLIFAATIALTQRDIKQVLAYSTVSQLGYMMMALGLGAYTAGVFHLYTHAFFKALLFLGAGSDDPLHGGGGRPRRQARQRHLLDGRAAQADAPHLLHLPRRLPLPGRGVRPSPASGVRTRSWSGRATPGPLFPGHRDNQGLPDRLLHVPRDLPGLLRPGALGRDGRR